MPTSAPGSSQRRRSAIGFAGFTLLELLVVVAIIAIASAGVAFAVRDNSAVLEKDAQRLAALLESARARSRLSGQLVRWLPTEDGFRFEGVPPESLPHAWLSPATHATTNTPLVLGPEPIIGPQSVVLTNAEHPGQSLRIATDGLRPFAVSAGQ